MCNSFNVDRCENAKTRIQEIKLKLGRLPEESTFQKTYNYSNVVKFNTLKVEISAIIASYYEGLPQLKAYQESLYFINIREPDPSNYDVVTSNEFNKAKIALYGLLDNILNDLNNPYLAIVPKISTTKEEPVININVNISAVDLIKLLEQTVEKDEKIPTDQKEAIRKKLNELASNSYIINIASSLFVEGIKKLAGL